MRFSLFLTVPRRSLWTSFLSPPPPTPEDAGAPWALYLCHHSLAQGGLVATPTVAYWRQIWGCARWIKKKPLIVFTFQEAKCFSNQKQKDLAQAGQAHISVKGETAKLWLSLQALVHFPRGLTPCHALSLPFLILLLEASRPDPALFCIQSVMGKKAGKAEHSRLCGAGPVLFLWLCRWAFPS